MGWIGMDCLVCTVENTSLYDNWVGLVGREMGGGGEEDEQGKGREMGRGR